MGQILDIETRLLAPKKPFVYRAFFEGDDRNYVGSSVHGRTRLTNHVTKLSAGKHHSPYLQNVYNKYGKELLRFEILEEIEDVDEILIREQYWIDKLESYGPKGYNMSPLAAHPTLGRKRPKEFSDTVIESNKRRGCPNEVKQNISDGMKRWHAENRELFLISIEKQRISQTGRLHTDTTKDIMRRSAAELWAREETHETARRAQQKRRLVEKDAKKELMLIVKEQLKIESGYQNNV